MVVLSDLCQVCKLSSFLTADAGHLYLMWPLLRQQERPLNGGFIFITRWNSLGHGRKVMNSVVGIDDVFSIHLIEDGVPRSKGKLCAFYVWRNGCTSETRVHFSSFCRFQESIIFFRIDWNTILKKGYICI